MATVKITNASVKAVKADTRRDVYLWDRELSGFGLKVTPNDTRTYLVQYRLGGRGSPTRRYTIGRHGSPWTPADARKEARRILGDVAAGRDPAGEKSETRRGMTVAELCDLYLAEGCATKKPSTLVTDRVRIERHIKPLLARKRVKDVARGDIERFAIDVAEGRTAADEKVGPRGRRGGKGTATRTLGLLGSLFTFAVNRGLREDNPVHGVKKWPDRKMERYLSAPELARLGEVLSEAEREGVNPSATNAIRLLTLTGCRKSEVLSLRWEEVDFQNACLRLGDAKTGQRVVPIGAPAVELLASLRHIGTSQGEYILPGSRGQGPFKGLDPVWRRLRVHAGLPDVRLYDLRHTLASVMAGRGESLLVIGKVLGHKVPSTTACYSHLTSDVVRTATEGVSAEIAAAMSGGGGNGAEVVELDTKRRAGNE